MSGCETMIFFYTDGGHVNVDVASCDLKSCDLKSWGYPLPPL